MNTKPSPAPWDIEEKAAPDGTVIVCPDGVAMRLILFYGQSHVGGTYSDGVTIAQYKANLRCMAASAEMLNALRAACEQYDGYSPEVLEEIAPDWLYEARQAIAKATNS
jgi:hypothetical protein